TGHLRWALLVAAWVLVGTVVVLLFVNQVPVLPVLRELVREASLWLAILLLGGAAHSRRGLAPQHRLLEGERGGSERLLRNILPEPIAERLKQRQGLIADASPQVTVLFADIADFNPHTEHSPPEE